MMRGELRRPSIAAGERISADAWDSLLPFHTGHTGEIFDDGWKILVGDECVMNRVFPALSRKSAVGDHAEICSTSARAILADAAALLLSAVGTGRSNTTVVSAWDKSMPRQEPEFESLGVALPFVQIIDVR
jgi:hypothetical protein